MTVVMIKLHLVPFGLLSLVVVCSGVITTLLESYLGAIVQNKYNWCTKQFLLQVVSGAKHCIYIYSIFLLKI